MSKQREKPGITAGLQQRLGHPPKRSARRYRNYSGGVDARGMELGASKRKGT